MKPLTIQKITEVTGGAYFGPDDQVYVEITKVVRDHREIKDCESKNQALFVCFTGERVDGHDFVQDAFSSGAVCCLAEKKLTGFSGAYILVESTRSALCLLAAYYRSLFSIPVIGITGSVGKTTAKEMTAHVLSEKYNVLKTAGNLNNEIGVPLTLLSLSDEHEVAVIEMGISEFGEMSRLAQMVHPDFCMITTIGHSHLENLKDLHGVLKAKSEIFSYMPPDSFAFLNGDDEFLRKLKLDIETITFGFDQSNMFSADAIQYNGTDGMDFSIKYENSGFRVHLPAFGRHFIPSALAAAAIGKQLGLTDDQIRNGLARYVPVGSRSKIRHTGYVTIIDDCYNANPDSIMASIRSLSSLSGRKVAILGDMKELGEHEADLHQKVGELAGIPGLDCLICCGDLAKYIYKGAITARSDMEAWFFPGKKELFNELSSLIRQNDTVLVKASHTMQFEEIVDHLENIQPL